jgi:HlyD family secretion protein
MNTPSALYCSRLSALLCCLWLSACGDRLGSQALGTLERDRITLKATAAEIVAARPLREGSQVKAGDLLIQLDDTLAQAQVSKARALLNNAKANQTKLHHGARDEEVAAARAQLERSDALLTQTEADFRRITTLARQKMVGQSELDAARSARDSARAERSRTQQNLLQLTNGSRPEDLAAADAQVAEAEANLAIEEHKLRQLKVVATRDGLLDRLPKYVGERVNIGDPVALLLAGNAPYARVYVVETARAHLRPGQQLQVHVDGYPQAFTGVLRWVSQDPAFTPYYALNASDRALLMYLAEIDLPDSAGDIPSGMPVQVDLPTGRP